MTTLAPTTGFPAASTMRPAYRCLAADKAGGGVDAALPVGQIDLSVLDLVHDAVRIEQLTEHALQFGLFHADRNPLVGIDRRPGVIEHQTGLLRDLSEHFLQLGVLHVERHALGRSRRANRRQNDCQKQ
ncbi:hypothetical protein [Alistipes finegoldii]|uniref:hypothetical protein n=1 Tax=Alistipes finegoldii TaxID=214856 RepID=UPI001FD04D6A|nr:hypothetical protein [Alistipes finegoldii]